MKNVYILFKVLAMIALLMLPILLQNGCGSSPLNAGTKNGTGQANGDITNRGNQAPPGTTPANNSDEEKYSRWWKEVENFNSKGLPRSALEVIEKIYALAKEKNHADELVKALIHKMHFISRVDEEARVDIFQLLTKELETSTFPVTSLLHSMLAEQYWNYYQENRYRFLNRTEASPGDIKQDDVRTWDLRKIVEEVVKQYRASLEDADKAKATRIDIYDKILNKYTDSRKYRPTLYDFLAHRAVDFYKNAESSLTEPVYRFSLDKDAYFMPAADFAKLEITSRDTLSFHYYALTILQDLIRFHLQDKDPAALVDVDLERLRFLNTEAVLSNKGIIYKKALEEMITLYSTLPLTADIYYELAVLYNAWGDTYQPLDKSAQNEIYQWYKKKAHEICKQTIDKFPGTPGAANCQYLTDQIEARLLNITIEQAAIPGQPFPALVTYKNQDQIYLRLVKTSTQEIEEKENLNYKKMLAFFIAQTPVHQWTDKLPDNGDYQRHHAEVKIDTGQGKGLEPGEYLLLVSDNKNFDFETRVVTYTFFTSSNIAYLDRHSDKKGLELHLVHRGSGQPLAGAAAQVWYREYSNTKHSYILKKGPLFHASADGYLNISFKLGLKNYFRLEFIVDDGKTRDHLFADKEFYLYTPYDRFPKRNSTFFFTDRSIYRPGQTVYFKGIMLYQDSEAGELSRILPNYSTRVTLYDVNSQKVADLELKTNEFGTFQGSFPLPTGRLNGRMRLDNGYGSTDFSVEEYKRPKFQVTFDPLKETYRLDDTVKVKGRATAYAGYNIDNADVKYRVVREVYYPYRWYFWWYVPPAPTLEILNETCKTDAKGEFEISFKAEPDLSIDKNLLPAFNFKVYADVTDINGETRGAEKYVPIGYAALQIGIALPEQLEKDQLKTSDKNNPADTFTLTTTALSGDFVPAAGNITVYRLKENTRLISKKQWDIPDRFTIEKKDYEKLFPYEPYTNEDDYRCWDKAKKVFDSGFDTAKNKEIRLTGLAKWESGKYLVEMTAKDRYGTPVKEMVYFTLYSRNDKTVPYTQLDWFTVPETVKEPGQKAIILVGTSAQNVRGIFEIEHRGQIVEKRYLDLSAEQRKLEIPIKEKHRGNLGVHFTFVKNNRVFQHSQLINVPWSNKELDITFETFRDKLKPGDKEEWRLRIKPRQPGQAAEADAFEMAAALYDESLDAFRPHYWNFHVFPFHYMSHQWDTNEYFRTVNSRYIGVLQKYSGFYTKYYDYLNWFGFYLGNYYYRQEVHKSSAGFGPMPARPQVMAMEAVEGGVVGGIDEVKAKKANGGRKRNGGGKDDADELREGEAPEEAKPADQPPTGGDLSQVKARTNFQETAFFYPQLRSGPEGEIVIAFTIPEALTSWKMLGFAHDKSLRYGLISNHLVTQKELMVVPNVPRFLREGDTLELAAKITNLSEKALTGKAQLMLFDAATMQPVDAAFKNKNGERPFTAGKGESGRVTWTLHVPDDVDAVTYRIVAQSGKFADGEEQALPILKNRMLVTESLPLPVRSLQKKDFRFDKLIDSGKSTTLKHQRLTLEFTANPVWYAVQALPYLIEYPYECLEQVFSRYYANSMASYIVNSNPKIKQVFTLWQNMESSDALLSNLEKNQELKTLILEETPWVMNGQDETERKKRIALLFDLNKMAEQMERALKKLKEGQLASGAWPWFHGMWESRYITQHIVCGFAHLDVLGVIDARKNPTIWAMLQRAVPYLDWQIKEDYEWLVKHEKNLEQLHTGDIQVHYLYARSYFKDIPMDDNVLKAFKYYKGQVKTYWLKFNNYLKGMIALILHRYEDRQTPAAIIASLKEYALHSEEMGMYWKDSYGYYWYQAPIETHALLIEAFSEIGGDAEAASVDEMKTWLLKQKQTQDWRTTKATVEACYALLLRGADWLAENKQPDITIGKKKPLKIDPGKLDDVNIEAGTGYFKTSWSGKEITPDMGYITVQNNNKIAAWGGLYWQYFENLDKITPAETPLKIQKQLFIEKPSPTGPKLHALEKNKLQVGDRIKVRIEIRVDRTMEYVHMKDMRASGFEPENVLSQCKWQGGLCYYESTKDASTNFFFSHLPKGTYVFEYPLRVSHAGDFSNGITTIQCMYAPEFSSHSEGIRVTVDAK